MKLGIVIGRFQPVHIGHITLIKQAIKQSQHVLIFLGSSFEPSTVKNPFSVQQRSELIRLGLTDQEYSRISFMTIKDSPYSDATWISSINRTIKYFKSVNSCKYTETTLFACEKDDATAKYLAFFKDEWVCELVSTTMYNNKLTSSTHIRDILFSQGLLSDVHLDMQQYNRKQLDFFMDWVVTPEFHNIQQDYDYYKQYNKIWESAPFPPIFVTCDSIVICNEHILLIRRGKTPGNGLYALPGGFLEHDETIRDGVFRELFEETKLNKNVPKNKLINCLQCIKQFDYPKRSLRGRVITNVGVFYMTEKELPTVIGSDDAASAHWIHIKDIYFLQDKCFDDHYHIISNILQSYTSEGIKNV